MKFVELKPGINIAKHKIISVEKIDEMTCRIGTEIGMYDSIYPSWRILMLLEQPDIEEHIAQQVDKPDTRSLFGNGQYFAG